MWFPTIPTDWTWTGQEIPAVLCFFLHANGSLRALISARALTSVFLRWYLLKFWAWNHSNNKVKQNKTIFCFCLFTDAQQFSQGLELRLQFLMQSKADPMQHPATSTEPLTQALLRATGHPWTVVSGHWAPGQSSALKLFNQKNTQATKIFWPG